MVNAGDAKVYRTADQSTIPHFAGYTVYKLHLLLMGRTGSAYDAEL